MAVSKARTEDIKTALEILGQTPVSCFYIVDSYGSLYPEEALTLADAVRMYTYGSAVANHREDESGQVAPGLLADLAIVDRNIFAAPVDEIGAARVVATWVRGTEVHTAP